MEKNIKYLLMCAAIPTSLALVGGDKANAADVDATNTSENTTAVCNKVATNNTSENSTATSNKVATNNKDKIITKCDVPKQNIINEGGHVNVEGQNATLSKDGKSVTYPYTVAFQRMHSSDHGQTVSDVLIRVPKIEGATVNFTLIGTRDSQGNPVTVNEPMKEVSYDDTWKGGEHTFDTPTSEELAAGKKPYVVNTSKYDYASLENGKIAAYALYASFDKSQAVKVEITLPFEIAKNIKYLPIDARMVWKSSQEGGIQGYESGAQNLEEYPKHSFVAEEGSKGLARFENPSLIDDSYVKDGHLIKSVTNPSTYITPNNGDWTNIPEDTNLDIKTFFHYAEIFSLRANPAVTYYISEKEDMADQDVSALYQGDVVVDYVIKGTNKQLKDTYTKVALTPIYNSNGKLITYNLGEDSNERPQKITVDGKNYVLVGTSSTSDAESGSLKEGSTHVVYEYVLETEVKPAPTPTPEVKPTPTPTLTNKEVTKVKKVEKKKQLPNTGMTTSSSMLGLVGIFAIAGLLLRFRKEK